CKVHEAVEAAVKIIRTIRQKGNLRKVDCNDTDRPREFVAAEEAATALAKLALVELEPAAHRPDVAGVEVGVHEVLEVRGAVLGSHAEQELGVGAVPDELLRNVVCRNRVLEAAAVGVAFEHYLDECSVYKVHFYLTVAVGEVRWFAADNSRLVSKVLGHHPVHCNIGEWSLAAPAARRVDAEHEALDCLFY